MGKGGNTVRGKRLATCSSAWLGEGPRVRLEPRTCCRPNNRFPSRGLTPPGRVLALTPKIRAGGKKREGEGGGEQEKYSLGKRSRSKGQFESRKRKNSLDSIPLSRSLTRLDITVTLGTQSGWYLCDSMRVYPRQYK